MNADHLRCPKDGLALKDGEGVLACRQGHRYPVIDGIPVLLRDDVPQTIGLASRSLETAGDPARHGPLFLESVGVSDAEREIIRRLAGEAGQVDPVVAVLVAATSGYAYGHLVGKLSRIPIPDIRLAPGEGKRLLDVGCSWGRWSIAAAQRGYRVTGIDPSLGALLAARRVSRQLGLEIDFVCADARYLPFAAESFDTAFSYSVLQHFAKEDARRAIAEIARVLRDGGLALVQMAHAAGIRNAYHLCKRGKRDPVAFEVRYWTRDEMDQAFSVFGRRELSVHCFFGLGLERADAALMRPLPRLATIVSDLLRAASTGVPMLARFADSIYVSARK